MTAPHDDLIRAFIAEGREELPDRAFDAVRGEIHRTRQRVVIGPWREPQMSNLAKVALAAAAVIAVLFGASRLLPSTSVDQYAATLAHWFGVPDREMATVLPNIGNFSNRNMGFV